MTWPMIDQPACRAIHPIASHPLERYSSQHAVYNEIWDAECSIGR